LSVYNLIQFRTAQNPAVETRFIASSKTYALNFFNFSAFQRTLAISPQFIAGRESNAKLIQFRTAQNPDLETRFIASSKTYTLNFFNSSAFQRTLAISPQLIYCRAGKQRKTKALGGGGFNKRANWPTESFYSPVLLIQNTKLGKIDINGVNIHLLVNRNYG
jgi:hypothetical protein